MVLATKACLFWMTSGALYGIVTFPLDSGGGNSDGTALCAAIEGRNKACLRFLRRRLGGYDQHAYTNMPSLRIRHGVGPGIGAGRVNAEV